MQTKAETLKEQSAPPHHILVLLQAGKPVRAWQHPLNERSLSLLQSFWGCGVFFPFFFFLARRPGRALLPYSGERMHRAEMLGRGCAEPARTVAIEKPRFSPLLPFSLSLHIYRCPCIELPRAGQLWAGKSPSAWQARGTVGCPQHSVPPRPRRSRRHRQHPHQWHASRVAFSFS